MEPAALQLDDIEAGYAGRPVLRRVSLRLAAGQSAVLIGPNGCGKSTLLRVVAGLVKPQAGNVRMHEVAINGWPVDARVRGGLGYLLQTSNVFSSLTVEENLRLAGGANETAAQRRLLAAFAPLAGKLQRRAGLLSGGERQALAVAMVLLHGPRLLLLDEPAAGLSPKACMALFDVLRTLQSNEGFAMLIVEHRLRQVQPIVDRVLVMREGRLVDDVDDTTRMLDAAWLAGHYTNGSAVP